MIKASVVTLIAEAQPMGVFDTPVETARRIMAEVKSVGMNEAYLAKSQGLEPEFVFVLKNFREYQGEKVCEWNGDRYKILRTYSAGDTIELTVERVIAHDDVSA